VNYPIKISQAGIDLIKSFEYFVPHTYPDSANILTIGYGSTRYKDSTKPKPGDTMTEPEATDLLVWAVNNYANALAGSIHSPLNQNQQDAILSFVYNIGVSAFEKSTALKLINLDPANPDIGYYWKLWDKATVNGKLVSLPGLTKRRIKEYELFRS